MTGRISRRTKGQQVPLGLDAKPCPECHSLIPDGALACPACTEKRALKGAMEVADRHLPDIASGRLRLRVLRKHRDGGEQHIALPNAYVGWCGLDLRDLHFCELKRLNDARNAREVCQPCVTEIDRRIAAAEDTPPWTEKP